MSSSNKSGRSRKATSQKTKSKKVEPGLDPNHASEAEKYDDPIPSREFILETLKQLGQSLTHPELAHQLDIDSEERFEALRRRLIAMTRDGQLYCNRRNQFSPKEPEPMLTGTVIGHRDGFGFLKLDTEGEDLFLSARQMQAVFDGDKVEVRITGEDGRGKKLTKIERVIERNTEKVVGRLFRESGLVFVEVENPKITQQIVITPEASMSAQHGQYVVAKITQQPSSRNHAAGEVIEILGDYMAPGMEIEVAIHSHGIPNIWPEEVEAHVKSLKTEVTEAEKQERIDIRHLSLVTIDGDDARDFDDAVYCEADSAGFRLFVAIADVSHYVRAGSALDLEAHNRGTSVYFPDHVVPMLPEVLSNGLCSLNPKVDRLCMVCEMQLDAEGTVTDSWFYEATMHSHARLTYDQVGKILEEPDSPDGIQLCEDYAELLPHLHQLYALFSVLKAKRKTRGAIDFDTVETKIEFGPERKIEKIVPTVRNDAHKLIEECMLCANVATAEFLSRQDLPNLFRIHEGPGAEKLENLRSFLAELGLWLLGGDTPTPAHYQALMEQISERPDFSVIQTMLLRSMSQATYGPDEKGHFGLAYEHYTHFTSPIRRYPDLLTHRALKHLIYNASLTEQIKRPEKLDEGRYPYAYDMAAMVALGEHCSMTERRADDATRDVQSWLKCEYLQHHLGEVFEGLISGVTNFGFFVELADLYVEGLVHVASLAGDYYQFDIKKQRLVGERSGTRYGLGDRVVVQVAQINIEERKVDLMLVSAEPRSKARKRIERGEASKKTIQPKNKTAGRDRGKHKERSKRSGSDGQHADARPSRSSTGAFKPRDEGAPLNKKSKKKIRKRDTKNKGKPRRLTKEPEAPKTVLESAEPPRPRKRRLAKKTSSE